MTYTVLYEKTSTGYSAYVPDLPGCISAGATLEAIEMHLDAMREDGDSIPDRDPRVARALLRAASTFVSTLKPANLPA